MTAWTDRAACRDMPKAVFFPPRGDIKLFAAAKRICAGCEVVDECLADDLEFVYPYGIISGIRAGLAAKERQNLRAARYRAEAV